MITNFDDYCIHQTAAPVAQPAQSDRNFYDRYWFNGFDAEGSYIFEVGLGLYPNRRIMDAHFSVSTGDRQVAFHGSRCAPKERGETQVGPLQIEILEPMRRLRVSLAPNEHNIECDLVFTAASVPHEEPQNIMFDHGHLIMHNSRFTQMGYWEGFFSIDGERTRVHMHMKFELGVLAELFMAPIMRGQMAKSADLVLDDLKVFAETGRVSAAKTAAA